MIDYDSEDIEARAWKMTALYWCKAYFATVAHPAEDFDEEEVEAALAETYMHYLHNEGEKLFNDE